MHELIQHFKKQLFPGRLTFDFNEAVAQARRDYPRETKKITFVNRCEPLAKQQIRDWILAASPSYQKALLRDSSVDEFVDICLSKRGLGLRDVISGRALLMSSDTRSWEPWGAPSRDVWAATLFNHELGHLILKGASPSTLREVKGMGDQDDLRRKRHQREIMADTFSLLRGWRLGYMNEAESNKLIQFRGKEDFVHDTSAALISLQKDGAENSRRLSPQKLKKAVLEHAQKFSI